MGSNLSCLCFWSISCWRCTLRVANVALSVFAFNHKRMPMSCLQWLDANIIGQTIAYSEATSGFEVKAWWHNTLAEQQYVTVSSRYTLHYLCLSSQKCLVITFNTKFLTSNMHGTYGCASQTPRVCYISHAKIVPGWMLIWVNFDPIQKIGVGILSQDNGKCAHLKFKVSGCKQVSKHTHVQCSHTSARLAQT